MQRFAQLIQQVTNTTRTNDKRDALVQYLREAPDADKLWLVALFTGRRPRRIISSSLLSEWCLELVNLPGWLFGESYGVVGDLAETIALMLPEPTHKEKSLSLADMMEEFRKLQSADDAAKKAFVLDQWKRLSKDACLVFNKLITGGFRVGVSQNLVIQALAIYAEKEVQAVAHMISGNWDPYSTSFSDLIHESVVAVDTSKPYPFYLAYALEGEAEELGKVAEWQIEWKWDGIRGQLIRRSGSLYLWSRGEELITDKFPEIESLFDKLPDGVVLDGEVLSYRDGLPIAFQYLQTRITRKTVSKKQLTEAPVVFMGYDLLEYNGEDLRNKPMQERRVMLEELVSGIDSTHLILSPLVQLDSWDAVRAEMLTARERNCEGFMLKRKSSVYQAGRRRGDWWKWKVQPLTVDAVLVYAQKGSGKRGNLYTDYTFAVRNGNELVAFAKAYSGLTDKEIAQIDKFIRANSLEQFGPVRTVKPELVFEIAFEGIAASNRHKSGVAVRFPRIARWRSDKAPDEINTLEELKQLLAQYGKT
ncbi:ATP-dependent DNA ligase [Polluticoccus soli]|uniref:ATP-dependent DNA ligase n=1 Tax=Polluticoccus soli TaxID=3034150 RepID=UPI0023E0F26F|nr:ATP-dependent DNA ligase [Flavipsychrobacter sp. JY13-12]